MQIDLELYRQEIRISTSPLVRLSAIDVSPDRPQRTLVFLHGFGGDARQWQYQLKAFADHNRVIALDWRGHGLADKPASEYTMSELQTDLQAALDGLGLSGAFVLVGHSFGGAMAAEYAAAHPERVEKLVLVATSGEYHIHPFYRFLIRFPLAFLRLIEPFTRTWLSAPPSVLKPLHDHTLSKWNGWSLFRSLTVPTLVIRGHRDRVFERTHFDEVPRAIPGAEDVEVPVSAHLVMLERREAVNRAIERFLEGPRSWRDTPLTLTDGSARAELVKERPWLRHYDEGVPFTIGLPHVPLHRFLRSTARRFPLHPAIRFEGNLITYRRLNQESSRFANLLRSLGVDKGDRVLLLLPNLPQTVIGYYGTLKAGAVVVFTTPLAQPEELARQVRDSGAKVLVTLTKLAEAARQAKAQTDLQHIIFTSVKAYLPPLKQLAFTLTREAREGHRLPAALGQGEHRLGQMLYSFPPRSPAVEVEPDDLAVIQYTGGTTAAPKGVMLTHRNLVANTLQTRHWIPDLREGRERFLSVLPFSHVYGMTTAMNVPVAMGATMVTLGVPAFDAGRALEAVKRCKPTLFPGVPSMYVAINNYPGVRKFGIQSVKACISGSAPLAVEVQEAFEKLTRGRLVEGYGLTEASPVTHANPLYGQRKVGSIGIPFPSTEAKIVDLAQPHKAVAVGQVGELAVRGPQVMKGYWGRGDDTDRTLTEDGWLLTGDVARMDEEGYFQIIARKSEMWYPDRPGQPAFPRDVEEVLYEVPQVKEAAVVAIANQPIAFVIAQRERPSAESLIAYCKRRLPPELVPRLVIFVDDFPRTFIGKVLRRELARRYEQQTDQP